jgi:hypothetical protein
MTEREWLESTDLKKLLDRLCRSKRRPSDRRLRLFAAGFWRWQAGTLLPALADHLLPAVAPGEEWAETGARPEGMSAHRGDVMAEERAVTAAKQTAELPQEWGERSHAQERVPPLFRCVFGNPFRPVQLRPG